MKVLIIEDDLLMLEMMSDILQVAHHDVKAVSNGYEALASLQSTNFDLIISDVRMSGLSGIEVGFETRKKGIATPIYYFSAEVDGINFYANDLSMIGNSKFFDKSDYSSLLDSINGMHTKQNDSDNK